MFLAALPSLAPLGELVVTDEPWAPRKRCHQPKNTDGGQGAEHAGKWSFCMMKKCAVGVFKGKKRSGLNCSRPL
jgi:hypothetical protein